ncbi:serine/threonine-protein kinase [Caenispirillum bisanense]|uniref:serine/threonine-protein kinase n=1 Tax=Caenispirillum bisanense TaxID=414052 RepID=UPI0031D56E2B
MIPVCHPDAFREDEEVLSKYRIIKGLKSGAHGSVYLAYNFIADRQVALKKIPINGEHEYSRIIESRAQSLCDHRNVVKFYSGDVAERNNKSFLLIEMEYIPEGSLADRIECEFVPVVDSVGYIKDVLFALERANSLGIIHRDVKPANIMLSRPNAKLSDFGVAYDMNLGMEVLPNRFYLPHGSPEAISGDNFGPQSDVFCSGVALFSAVNNISGISGIVNARISDADFWSAVKAGSLINKIGFEKYVPNKVRRIISTACAIDLGVRYKVCREFRNALERIRFKNDWVPTSSDQTQWRSSLDKGSEIVISGTKRYTVDLVVGGRRVRPRQTQHDLLSDAKAAVLKLVRDTTAE